MVLTVLMPLIQVFGAGTSVISAAAPPRGPWPRKDPLTLGSEPKQDRRRELRASATGSFMVDSHSARCADMCATFAVSAFGP